MTFSDGTITKVLKLLVKYKLSPEGTIVTGELNPINPKITLKFRPHSMQNANSKRMSMITTGVSTLQ